MGNINHDQYRYVTERPSVGLRPSLDSNPNATNRWVGVLNLSGKSRNHRSGVLEWAES